MHAQHSFNAFESMLSMLLMILSAYACSLGPFEQQFIIIRNFMLFVPDFNVSTVDFKFLVNVELVLIGRELMVGA